MHDLRMDLVSCSSGSGGASQGNEVNWSGNCCWGNVCWVKKASSPSCSGVPKRSDELISEVGSVDVGGGSGGGRNWVARSSMVGGTKRWEIAEMGMLCEGE